MQFPPQQQFGDPQPRGMHSHNPYGMDPNFHYWYHRFSWWYSQVHNSGPVLDTKIQRIAFSLGGMLIKDKLDSTSLETLKSIKIKVLDYGMDGEIASYFEALVGKVEIVKSHEIPFHLVHNKLQPSQYMLVISGLSHPQPIEILQAIYIFVNEGGRVLFYDSAVHLIGGLFLGKIAPAPPSTTVSAKLKILSDKELFESFKNTEINLEFHRYPLEILDRQNVTILTKIQGQIEEPLFVKFTQGLGTVFILVSKMLTKENVFKDPKQKTVSTKEVEEYLVGKGGSKETIAGWQAAVKVGYSNAYVTAISALPSMEMMAKLLIRERITTEKIPEIASTNSNVGSTTTTTISADGMITH